ncbi:hypothetical protein L7F22_068409 [Adiantum nelumboides]|nr:hypothetical protein [Adiantum nelumboides]
MGRSKRIEWQYVEKIKALRKAQWTCKCNFCGHVWGGGPHRIRSHLLSLPGQGVGPCDSVTEDVKDIVRRLHADASSDGKDSREAIDALVDDLGRSASQSQGDASLSTHGEGSTHASGSSKSNVNSSKKRKVAQGAGGLPAAFGLQARKQADQALRRFFYAEDVPEWKVRSPYFLDMIKAIGNVGPSYVPPSYHALRTTELNDEHTFIHQKQVSNASVKQTAYKDLPTSLTKELPIASRLRPRPSPSSSIEVIHEVLMPTPNTSKKLRSESYCTTLEESIAPSLCKKLNLDTVKHKMQESNASWDACNEDVGFNLEVNEENGVPIQSSVDFDGPTDTTTKEKQGKESTCVKESGKDGDNQVHICDNHKEDNIKTKCPMRGFNFFKRHHLQEHLVKCHNEHRHVPFLDTECPKKGEERKRTGQDDPFLKQRIKRFYEKDRKMMIAKNTCEDRMLAKGEHMWENLMSIDDKKMFTSKEAYLIEFVAARMVEYDAKEAMRSQQAAKRIEQGYEN